MYTVYGGVSFDSQAVPAWSVLDKGSLRHPIAFISPVEACELPKQLYFENMFNSLLENLFKAELNPMI